MRVAIEKDRRGPFWKLTALDGAERGRVLGYARTVILRDATFGHAGGRILGSLDGANMADPTEAGDRSVFRYSGWCDSDRAYVRMGRDHGTEGHPTEGGAPMVVAATRKGKPLVIHFDPCTVPAAA